MTACAKARPRGSPRYDLCFVVVSSTTTVGVDPRVGNYPQSVSAAWLSAFGWRLTFLGRKTICNYTTFESLRVWHICIGGSHNKHAVSVIITRAVGAVATAVVDLPVIDPSRVFCRA